jgi:hypothetical protein
MSHKRKGQLTASDEYRRHLRPFGRREFWSGERMAERTLIRDLHEESLEPVEIEEWDDWDPDFEDVGEYDWELDLLDFYPEI